MGPQKNKLAAKRSAQTELPSLKKIPVGKPAVTKKTVDKNILVQPQSKKDFSSIMALLKRRIPDAPAATMPADIKPMLATLVNEPFNDEDWQFELKLDGYRTLAYLNAGKVELRSRNNNSFNKKFQPVFEALSEWPVNVVVDGEIVVLNEEGVPDFSGIQLWDKKQQGQLVYYVFDLLWLDGMNVMEEPLNVRRDLLKQIIPESGVIRFSDHIDEAGKDFFELTRLNRLEGIIAKRKNAPYYPDTRSRSWLKIKAEERHEAVICGYTRKKDTDRNFSSLVLGVYENGTLKFIGQTGTGFTMAMQEELMRKMLPHITKKSPFAEEPVTTDKAVWLKPFLVCEVKYTELTKEGIMRHASFQGLREDKAAFELNIVKPVELEDILSESEGMQLFAPSMEEAVVYIDGHELKLTNLKKIFWPGTRTSKGAGSGMTIHHAITKGEMMRYYFNMADYIMPYMKDRPQSLNRYPNGINGKSFYHKNMGGKVDKWLKTFTRVSESSQEAKDFLICTNTASLVYMANLGCIEMNPWHSRVQSPLYPDWSVVDLDPGNISFDKVIETAQVVKQVLDSLQITSYVKTSGSTGIHIYIPLGAKYNYEQSRQLAELIANLVHEELPLFTSLERNPRKRMDKIYIDYLQNRPIQTICAPYSVRPRPGATVSAPLHWDEVKKGLTMSGFTLRNMMDRVKSEGDLFNGVMEKGIDLNKVLKGLASLVNR